MQPTRLTTSSVTVKPGPTSFTEAEWAEVTAAAVPGALGLRSHRARRALGRLLASVEEASASLGFSRSTICAAEGVILHAMWTNGTAWGSWDAGTWLVAAHTARNSCRAAVLGIGICVGGLTGADALTMERLEATTLARRVFGSDAVDREVERVRAYLTTVGYGAHVNSPVPLMTAVSRLLLEAGRAELDAITLEALVRAHDVSPPLSEHSQV